MGKKEQACLCAALEKIYGAAAFVVSFPDYMNALMAVANQILLDLPSYEAEAEAEEVPQEEQPTSEEVSQ